MALSNNVAMTLAAAVVVLLASSSPARANPLPPTLPASELDITKLGARGDGKTDSTQAIQQAWENACAGTGTHRILIPPGNFLTGGLQLRGPCTSSSIIIRLDGNLLGTGDLNAYKKNWIEIKYVSNLSINGHGTIDGQGPLVWSRNECSKNYNCKILPNVCT